MSSGSYSVPKDPRNQNSVTSRRRVCLCTKLLDACHHIIHGQDGSWKSKDVRQPPRFKQVLMLAGVFYRGTSSYIFIFWLHCGWAASIISNPPALLPPPPPRAESCRAVDPTA